MSDLGDALSEVAVEWGDAAADIYPDLCDIKRMAASGGSASLTPIHEGVPCSVRPAGGGKDTDAIRAKAIYEIEMPFAIGGTTPNTTKSEDLISVRPRGLQGERVLKISSAPTDGIKVFARGTIES